MPDVTFTVDGKKLTAPAGTLLIDACRKAGIEIPAFCYYPGLSLQAACRMCVVRQEKVPKLQTACTTTVAEGQVFITESPEIAQARKATIELLLGNHPLDCPVCDAGGECELQDMTFKYGAGESLYAEAKHHRDEQQWSPAVFYDRPRCILCYRCIRMCGEGMDVWALGVHNRGADSVIVPNDDQSARLRAVRHVHRRLPRGRAYQRQLSLQNAPLGDEPRLHRLHSLRRRLQGHARRAPDQRRLRDCPRRQPRQERHQRRLPLRQGPLRLRLRRKPRSPHAASRPQLRRASSSPPPGSTRCASPPASSKKFATLAAAQPSASSAPTAPPTKKTTCCRNLRAPCSKPTTSTTSAPPTTQPLPAPSPDSPGKTASLRDIASAPAILLVGGNPTEEHPLLAWLLRTNVRLNRARLYIANSAPIKLDRQAKAVQRLPADGYKDLAAFLSAGKSDFSKAILAEESLVVIFGQEFRGKAVESLVAWGLKRENVRFAYLGDHSNSRGAADMGLFPDLLPGYVPVAAPGAFAEYPNLPAAPGKTMPQMLEAAASGELGALLVVGANPVSSLKLDPAALQNTFVVVQDLFLTETAALADVVLPAASLYEKSGTVTNTFGDMQLVRKAADRAGVKPDFEILVRLAGAMGADIKTLVPFGTRGTTADLGQSRGAQAGEADRHAVWLEANGLEPKLSPFDPLAVLDEIERLVPGYTLDRINLFAGNDVHTEPKSTPGFVPVAALASAGTHRSRARHSLHLRNAGPLQPSAQATRGTPSQGTGRIRSRLRDCTAQPTR